jgi:hypothetical protein
MITIYDTHTHAPCQSKEGSASITLTTVAKVTTTKSTQSTLAPKSKVGKKCTDDEPEPYWVTSHDSTEPLWGVHRLLNVKTGAYKACPSLHLLHTRATTPLTLRWLPLLPCTLHRHCSCPLLRHCCYEATRQLTRPAHSACCTLQLPPPAHSVDEASAAPAPFTGTAAGCKTI